MRDGMKVRILALLALLGVPAIALARSGGTPNLHAPFGNDEKTNQALQIFDACLGSLLGPSPSCTSPFSGLRAYSATEASSPSITNTVVETVLHTKTLPQMPAVGGVIHVRAGGFAGSTAAKTMTWAFRIGGADILSWTMTSIDAGVTWSVDLTCVIKTGVKTLCNGVFTNGTNTTPVSTPKSASAIGVWPTAVLDTTGKPNFNNSDGADFLGEDVFVVEVASP